MVSILLDIIKFLFDLQILTKHLLVQSVKPVLSLVPRFVGLRIALSDRNEQR